MFFKELDGGNALENDNYILILEKMYWAGFSNISGNPLKKVTYKNGAKFPQYGNIHGNTHVISW